MKQMMVISAVGSDRPGLVHDLSKKILDCGGNVAESRMIALGSEFAMLLLVSGEWHTLARLEGELERLEGGDRLTVSIHRTETRQARDDLAPYAVDVVCLDQAGIVANLSGFFAQRNVEIAELNTRSYPAPHTGAQMFSLQLTVNVPSRLPVAQLREDFMVFCEGLNLDAILEPLKS